MAGHVLGKGNTAGVMVGAGGVCWHREWEEPGDFHPIINEWGGAWAVPGQVWVVSAVPGESKSEF
jgi:hypothetical protein